MKRHYRRFPVVHTVAGFERALAGKLPAEACRECGHLHEGLSDRRTYRLDAQLPIGLWKRTTYSCPTIAVDAARWFRKHLRRTVRVIDVRTGEVIYPKEAS